MSDIVSKTNTNVVGQSSLEKFLEPIAERIVANIVELVETEVKVCTITINSYTNEIDIFTDYELLAETQEKIKTLVGCVKFTHSKHPKILG